MCKTDPRIVVPDAQKRTDTTVSGTVKRSSAANPSPVTKRLPTVNPSPAAKRLPAVNPSPAAKRLPAVNPSPVTKRLPAVNPSPAAKRLPAVNPSPAAKRLPTVNPSPAAKRLPAVNPSRIAKPSSTPFPEGEMADACRKAFSGKMPPPEEEQTLRELLGEDLENEERWCAGFAHGTTYGALSSIMEGGNILPYAELPFERRRLGRGREWKKKGVFFRIVKKEKGITDSLGSTGASGGVILFMPMSESLDLKLLSLCSTDTQFYNTPAPPCKFVFESLERSRNLATAEIAFGERIPLRNITEVFLLKNRVTGDIINRAARRLERLGFCEEEGSDMKTSRYRHFHR